MEIRLNGKPTETDAETVSSLLESIGIDPTKPGTAVAVNERVIPRAKWRQTDLCEGDAVEIIRAVQGG